MLDLNLALIQAGLEIFLERFSKIQEIVQTEVEKASLGEKNIGD